MTKFRALIDRTPPEELGELAELFTDAQIGAGESTQLEILRRMKDYQLALDYIAERVLQVS